MRGKEEETEGNGKGKGKGRGRWKGKRKGNWDKGREMGNGGKGYRESGQNVFRPSWVQACSATAGLKRVPF